MSQKLIKIEWDERERNFLGYYEDRIAPIKYEEVAKLVNDHLLLQRMSNETPPLPPSAPATG